MNIVYAVELWEAYKVRQSAITESQHCDVMSEHLLCMSLNVEALHFRASAPLRNVMRRVSARV